MKPAAFLLLLPALALVQGPTRTVEIEWGDARRFESEQTLAPGHTVEACTPLEKTQQVHWTFHADGNLSFALFHRIGKRPIYAERRQRTRSLQGAFNPQQAVRHCWSWTNAGSQTVQMAFMLRH